MAIPPKRDFTFSWSSSWFPLTYTAFTDKKRPTQHYLLGAPIVVWHHNHSWHAMLDKCPHRWVMAIECSFFSEVLTLKPVSHAWQMK
jgi:nitrite reductase/ring-hydroxylating ferredoxin subunit